MLIAMVCRSSESVGDERDNLLELAHHVALQRLRLGRRRRLNLFDRLALRRHKRRDLRKLAQPHPLIALGKHEEALVRHLDDLVHGRAGADVVQVGRLRRILARIALRHHQDRLLLAQRLDQLDRALPAHRQRQNRMGKQHGVPYRQNRNAVGRPPELSGSSADLYCAWFDYTYEIACHGLSLSALISDFLTLDASSYRLKSQLLRRAHMASSGCAIPSVSAFSIAIVPARNRTSANARCPRALASFASVDLRRHVPPQLLHHLAMPRKLRSAPRRSAPPTQTASRQRTRTPRLPGTGRDSILVRFTPARANSSSAAPAIPAVLHAKARLALFASRPKLRTCPAALPQRRSPAAARWNRV